MGEKDYHPQMHTLEHLLNGTISRKYNCQRAFSTHIEKKKSKIDYRFPRNLTETEVAELEQTINKIIDQNVPVSETFIPIETARQQYDLSRLPEGVAGDLRIVQIGDYDSCPCIGPHVGSTLEIGGKLKIISTDHNPESSVLRIRFKIESLAH